MASPIEDPRLRLAIYSLGLAGETGEVVEPIKKHLGHGHPLDPEALLVELGDVMWYIAAIATELGFSLSDIATRNLLKLQAAYPFGFSPEASLARRGQEIARQATTEDRCDGFSFTGDGRVTPFTVLLAPWVEPDSR